MQRFTGAVALVLLCALAPACGSPPYEAALPPGYRLVQKREYQALYGPDGRLARVLQDADKDGRADAVVLYRPDGRPASGEIDTDRDGVVDRWERFALDGTVDLVGRARSRLGRPDYWEHVRADGVVWQRDWDDDGDGRPDRSDNPAPEAETVNAAGTTAP